MSIPVMRYARLRDTASYMITPRDGDVGFDLRTIEPLDIYPDTLYTIATGLAIEIPTGFVGLIWSRSGRTFKHHFICWGAGVIDPSYRGEVMISMYSRDQEFKLKAGDAVAQLLILPYVVPTVLEASLTELSKSERGVQGFGSTDNNGLKS